MHDLVHATGKVFDEDGTLSRQHGFEHREQQQEMAVAIARALSGKRHLIVEAPTGVGKSLAYLVPSILHSITHRRKAVISTHTKNLQQQLLHQDIPIVRAVLKKDFSVCVLKGRHNYLCTSRLSYALASTGSMFDADATGQIMRIQEWSLQTHTGDIEDLGFSPRPDVWDMVCSEQEACTSRACGKECFFQRKKEEARGADVVIVNHALFFTLMMTQQEPDEKYLFENDFVVFDEAHMVESVAGYGIGKTLSRHKLLGTLNRLYSRRTKRGLLAREKTEIRKQCEQTTKAAEAFFDAVQEAARHLASASTNAGRVRVKEVRIRTPNIVADSITQPLTAFGQTLGRLVEGNKDQPGHQELAVARRALWEAQVLIEEFLVQTHDGFAYWVASGPGDNILLCTSPVDIAETMRSRLFREGSSVVMTSATLSVNGSLDYFKRRIGAEAIEGILLGTPFDYRRQMSVYIARDISEPESSGYERDLPGWILDGLRRSQGKALVLFTSSALMRRVADSLRERMEESGYTLLVQESARERHELLQRFKEDVHSVLFGLDSFWMGVDVPGAALEHVIITRLPFSVPSHPLIEARLESIAARGGDAFLQYTLPEAVIKFRQGVGRLIRTRADRGMVTILDSRTLKRQYGRIFLSSIPECPISLLSRSGDAEPISMAPW